MTMHPASAVRGLNQSLELSFGTHHENRAVFDIRDIDITVNVDAKAIAERLIAVSLDPVSQLVRRQVLISQVAQPHTIKPGTAERPK